MLVEAGQRRRRAVHPDHHAVEVGHQDQRGGGVQGGAGELLRGLEPAAGVVLRRDVLQLRGEGRFGIGGEQRDGDVDPGAGAVPQPGLRAPAVQVAGQHPRGDQLHRLGGVEYLGQPAPDRRPGPADDPCRRLVDVHDLQDGVLVAQEDHPQQRLGEVAPEEPLAGREPIEQPVPQVHRQRQRGRDDRRAQQVGLHQGGHRADADLAGLEVGAERAATERAQVGHQGCEAHDLPGHRAQVQPQRGPREHRERQDRQGQRLTRREDQAGDGDQRRRLHRRLPRGPETPPAPGREGRGEDHQRRGDVGGVDGPRGRPPAAVNDHPHGHRRDHRDRDGADQGGDHHPTQVLEGGEQRRPVPAT